MKQEGPACVIRVPRRVLTQTILQQHFVSSRNVFKVIALNAIIKNWFILELVDFKDENYKIRYSGLFK